MFAIPIDLENRITLETLKSLTDDNRDGLPDERVNNAAILYSETTIKQIISSRYGLFFNLWLTPATTPPILTQACIDISIYYLFTRAQGAVELWTTNYNNTIALLQQIAAGQQDVIGSDGTNYTILTAQGSQGVVHAPRSNTQAATSFQFSRDSLTNYITPQPLIGNT